VSAATAAGCRAGLVGKTSTSLAERSTRPGLPGRSGRGAASAARGSSVIQFASGGLRTRPFRLPGLVPFPRVIQQDAKPHERDRLKYAGRFEEGQTAKVVKNGEGGATAGVEARNEESGATGDGQQPIPSGLGCRRTLSPSRRPASLLARLVDGSAAGTPRFDTSLPAPWCPPRPAERNSVLHEPYAWRLANEDTIRRHWQGKTTVPVQRSQRAVSSGIPPEAPAGPSFRESPSSEGCKGSDGWGDPAPAFEPVWDRTHARRDRPQGRARRTYEREPA
jgi:hypothetical protein